MISNKVIYFSILGYAVLFTVAVFGFGLLRIKRRKERTPLQFKLLRGPGETLRKKLSKADEAEFLRIFLSALMPVLVGSGFLVVLAKIAPKTPLVTGLILTAVLFLSTALVCGRYVLGHLYRYRHDWLGYMGERAVGEELTGLYARGFRIFHDVPAEGATKPFNLDHVVVGPSGLWLIETKTRRKGRARPGFKDHKVTFDGTKLIWPWGEDRTGIDQAQFEAQWLNEFIKRVTGIAVVAKPILALPGWYVHEKALGAVRVLNHKNLCSAITGRGAPVLTPDQIDLIARQLDQRCRDVED